MHAENRKQVEKVLEMQTAAVGGEYFAYSGPKRVLSKLRHVLHFIETETSGHVGFVGANLLRVQPREATIEGQDFFAREKGAVLIQAQLFLVKYALPLTHCMRAFLTLFLQRGLAAEETGEIPSPANQSDCSLLKFKELARRWTTVQIGRIFTAAKVLPLPD